MEIWKKIEVNSNYEVSNLGRIKAIERKYWNHKNKSFSIKKEVIKKISTNNTKGYCRVILSKDGKNKTYAVHRLVAQAFIENKLNKSQVNHINGIKTDNRVENLEWVTASENVIHSINVLKNVNHLYGEESKLSVLKEKDVFEIVKLLKTKNALEISKIYNVKPTTITEIIARRSWKHLDLDIPNKIERSSMNRKNKYPNVHLTPSGSSWGWSKKINKIKISKYGFSSEEEAFENLNNYIKNLRDSPNLKET